MQSQTVDSSPNWDVRAGSNTPSIGSHKLQKDRPIVKLGKFSATRAILALFVAFIAALGFAASPASAAGKGKPSDPVVVTEVTPDAVSGCQDGLAVVRVVYHNGTGNTVTLNTHDSANPYQDVYNYTVLPDADSDLVIPTGASSTDAGTLNITFKRYKNGGWVVTSDPNAYDAVVCS